MEIAPLSGWKFNIATNSRSARKREERKNALTFWNGPSYVNVLTGDSFQETSLILESIRMFNWFKKLLQLRRF